MDKERTSLKEIGEMMHEVIRVFRKLISEQSEIKITMEQFGLLHAISQKTEDVIQKNMAEIMGKDKSAILRVIDSLEKKQLVRRVVDKNDRRKNYLMVTKKGELVLNQYLKINMELIDLLEQGLTNSDINTFFKVVNHIKSKAKNM
ncbi:MAG: MarR family transcriptional regulator [Bacteroidales bacterium]|nr:MarR family transcriptional regulator [Bacteroidales bacterium]